jgi:5'-nucleotidase
MKSILLTNDDGINAEGLNALKEELCRIAHVLVVAPDQERSAVSHGLTIHTPLKFKEAGADSFSLNGTPADCVMFALDRLFIKPPDLVISGINHGANLGDDVMYSGTVAAAREAARHGVPAIAISQEYKDGKKIRFKEGIEFIRDMVKAMLRNTLGGELLLNVNIPIGKIRGMKITRQDCSEHPRHFSIPDGEADSSPDFWKKKITSDRRAVFDGYVSVTPLERDQTDYIAARLLTETAAELFAP